MCQVSPGMDCRTPNTGVCARLSAAQETEHAPLNSHVRGKRVYKNAPVRVNRL